jgi:hypothetical protein
MKYCINLDNSFKYNLNNKGKALSITCNDGGRGVEVLLYLDLTSALSRNGWTMPHPSCFTQLNTEYMPILGDISFYIQQC